MPPSAVSVRQVPPVPSAVTHPAPPPSSLRCPVVLSRLRKTTPPLGPASVTARSVPSGDSASWLTTSTPRPATFVQPLPPLGLRHWSRLSAPVVGLRPNTSTPAPLPT